MTYINDDLIRWAEKTSPDTTDDDEGDYIVPDKGDECGELGGKWVAYCEWKDSRAVGSVATRRVLCRLCNAQIMSFAREHHI